MVQSWSIFIAITTLFALAVLILLNSCSPTCSRKQHTSFLWITIDTLRSDHLGCYGYTRPTSPAIDQLAKQSLLYENAISSSPWTKPSMGAMLFSQHPCQLSEKSTWDHFIVRPGLPSLAELLRAKGYSTAAFINQPSMIPGIGYERGFGENYLQMDSDDAVVDASLRWLANQGEQPFFCYVHLLAPHQPYDYVPEVSNAFINEEIGTALNHRLWPNKPWTGSNYITPETREDIDNAIRLYDGEVRYADQLVGKILTTLSQTGLREHTCVVVTSDHGEEFFDHGGWEHAHSFYDELIHVPLLVSLPGSRPNHGRIRSVVSLLDVAPTLLDLAGLHPSSSFMGQPLPRQDDGITRIAYSEFASKNPEYYALRTDEFKYIQSFTNTTSMVFDLKNDPGEKKNIAGNIQLKKTLQKKLQNLLDDLPPVAWKRVAHINLYSQENHHWRIKLTADFAMEITPRSPSLIINRSQNNKTLIIEDSTGPGKECRLELPFAETTRKVAVTIEIDGRPLRSNELVTHMEHGYCESLLKNIALPASRIFLSGSEPDTLPMEHDAVAKIWIEPEIPNGETINESAVQDGLRELGYIQ